MNTNVVRIEDLPLSECMPRYPEAVAELVVYDGDSFVIAARVAKALLDAGAGDEITEFLADARWARSTNELLSVCLRWVSVK